MSEKDKLFNFMSGLQTWAQAELKRQGVKDIPTVMAATEGLVDFCISNPTLAVDKRKSKEGKKGKSKDWKVNGKENEEGESSMRQDQKNQTKLQQGCFICGGLHRARECPKKKKINAIISQDSDGDEDLSSAPFRLNPLQSVNTLAAESYKGLMCVQAVVNGREVWVMLDSSATNNFLSKRAVDYLGLQVYGSTSRIKVVNLEVTQVCGVAETSLQLGAWQGSCRLTVVPIDEFDLILGMEFLVDAKVSLMPHLRGILIGDKKCPVFIQTDRGIQRKGKGSVVSTKQGCKELGKGEQMWVAAMVQFEQDVVVEEPDETGSVCEKEQPPRMATIHNMKLEHRARPLAKVPYRMASCDLALLRKQWGGLLEALQASMTPFGDSVWCESLNKFVIEHGAHLRRVFPKVWGTNDPICVDHPAVERTVTFGLKSYCGPKKCERVDPSKAQRR